MAAVEPTSESRKTIYTAVAVSVLLAISIAVAAARPDVKEPAKVATLPLPANETSAGVSATATPNPRPSVVPSKQPAPPESKPSAAPGTRPQTAVQTKPVEKGSKLTQLKTPPERTIGLIVIPDDFKTARFSVTFTPYGWGPSGSAGGRLVAKITKSEAVDAGAKALNRDFTGRNATLWCTKAIASEIKVGGTYSGTVEVRRSGDTGMLVVTELTKR